MKVSPTGAERMLDVYVGTRVRMRRLHLGLQLDELALMAGLAKEVMQALEEGKVKTTAALVLQMSQLLEAPVSWFFEGLGTSGRREVGGRTTDAATVGRMATEAEDLEILRFAYQNIRSASLRSVLVAMARMLADADLASRSGPSTRSN
jgi:transcriptional regulator with XRE-family HTH domain